MLHLRLAGSARRGTAELTSLPPAQAQAFLSLHTGTSELAISVPIKPLSMKDRADLDAGH